MTLLEQIQKITNWDYCKLAQQNDDEDFYHFGWKSGLHFYLTDYRTIDDFGQYYMLGWLDRKLISAKNFQTLADAIQEIKSLINDK